MHNIVDYLIYKHMKYCHVYKYCITKLDDELKYMLFS
jgi:hypothetical protein